MSSRSLANKLYDNWSTRAHLGIKTRYTYRYAHLAAVRFEHSVCRGSLMTTLYKYICEVFLLLVSCPYGNLQSSRYTKLINGYRKFTI